jgi:6-phosphogluconolactonase
MDMPISVRAFPTVETLNRAVAGNLAELVRSGVDERGQFALALAGGNTAKALNEYMASNFSGNFSWNRVHLFWGDERYVPHDHRQSNYRMVVKVCWTASRFRPGTFIRCRRIDDPEDGARAYEATLKDFFKADWPSFDLVLLGMGPDGHTASLFPGTSALSEVSRPVIAVRAPVEPPLRLSLTLPAVLSGKAIYFLIAGKDKAAALKSVLEDADAADRYPARRVFDAAGSKLICWVDAAAYS